MRANAASAASGVGSNWARMIAPSTASAAASACCRRCRDAGSTAAIASVMSCLWRRVMSATSGSDPASSPRLLMKAQPRKPSPRNHSANDGTIAAGAPPLRCSASTNHAIQRRWRWSRKARTRSFLLGKWR
jgi:hypothetical protein